MEKYDRRFLNPWAEPTPIRSHDIAKLDPNFETWDHAIAERDHRIDVLQKGSLTHQTLAQKLESCGDVRCLSAICPLCMRQLRIWFVAESLRLFESEPAMLMLTLIIPADVRGGQTERRLHETEF